MLNVKAITVSKMTSHRAGTVQMREESERYKKVRRDVI